VSYGFLTSKTCYIMIRWTYGMICCFYKMFLKPLSVACSISLGFNEGMDPVIPHQ
jgi:hypothetical protein